MDGRRILERVVATLGVLGLFAVLPFYVAAGLAAPMWAIVLLLAFWLVLLVTAIRWFTRWPWPILALPFVAAGVWWLTLTLGESLLGWQA
ncbi:hypothetical protein [Knoellia sp. LjRoot47]|uniref:hypothetical protein n=1 Tax=Knoellia sp. LjRoot47 TaxID=3342330 RepID=UPI003ECC6F28